MVAFSKIALAALSAGAAVASPLAPKLGPLQLFDELKSIPSSWVSKGAASKDSKIRAQIGLKQRNIPQLQAKLLDISDPNSKNYGNWLSKEEIDEMTAPSELSVAAVKGWLALHGITDVQMPTSDWIEFTAPVSQMETLLETKYEMFAHATQNMVVARTMKYSVPEELHSMIDLITPTTAFYEKIAGTTEKSAPKSRVSKRQSCNTSKLTPGCINQLYNVDYTSSGSTTVGTTKLLDVGADHGDYATFSQDYVNGGIKYDFEDVPVQGGTNPGSSGDLGEGNLDTQYAGGLSTPNINEFLALGPDGNSDSAFTDGIANLASYLASSDSPPSAVSTSYGGVEDYFSASYLTRVCNDFMKAGSRGVSVFFSSGDSGVGGNQASTCPGDFPSLWPASCPWSTAVGGTEYDNGEESVAQFIFPNGYHGSSGGGFSAHFSVPDYQSADTAAYQQKLGGEYQGKYNPSNRGYPDVSLVAVNYQVIINGQPQSIGGTSASSPSWAGLVSVLNDYRQSQGKSNLGFLNPLLYGNGRSALRDVTRGSNTGCDSDGYPATSGWDAATGLGTLDFGKLRAMI